MKTGQIIVFNLSLGIFVMATCQAAENVKTLDLRRGESRIKFSCLAISPNNKWILVTAGNRLNVIEIDSGRVLQQMSKSPFVMRFTKDGSRVYTVSNTSHELYAGDLSRGYSPQFTNPPGYVGISLANVDRRILISQILPGGPVAKLQEIGLNDELVAIAEGRNGSFSKVYSVQDAVRKLQGPAGTYLRLSIIPQGKTDPTNYLLRRVPARVQGVMMSFQNLETPAIKERVTHCVRDGRHNFDDSSTGETLSRFQTIDVRNIGIYAMSPDSRKFAVLSAMKNGHGYAIEVFDIATAERLAFIPHLASTYYDLAFSADGSQLYAATQETIEFSDIKAKRTLGRMFLEPNPVENTTGSQRIANTIAVSPKDIFATGSSTGVVRLWDAKKGLLLQTLGEATNHAVEDVQFSDDGSILAWYAGSHLHWADLSKWNLEVPATPEGLGEGKLAGFQREQPPALPEDSGQKSHAWHVLTVMTHPAHEGQYGRLESFLRFSPDSKTFYVGGSLGLIPVAPTPPSTENSGRRGGSVADITNSVADAVESGTDRKPGIVPINDSANLKYSIGGSFRSLRGEHGKMPGSVDRYLVADGKWLCAFECREGEADRELDCCKRAALSPDGKLLAVLGGKGNQAGELHVFEADTGKRLFDLEERIDGQYYHFEEVAFLGDSTRLIALDTASDRLLLMAARSGEILDAIPLGQFDSHRGLIVTANGKRILLGQHAFDAQTAQVIQQPKDNNAWRALAATNDGKTVLCFYYYRLYLLDGTKQSEIGPAFHEECTAACFSPDGKHLAVARGNRMEIWNVAHRRLVEVIADHLRPVDLLVFSPDGKRLASNARDGSTRIWDTTSLGSRENLKLLPLSNRDPFEEQDAVRIVEGNETREGVIIGKVEEAKWLVEFEARWTKIVAEDQLQRVLPDRRSYGEEQALGAPDVPRPGDDSRAWVPATQDKREWLFVQFKAAVKPKQLLVLESFNPGAIYEASLISDDGIQAPCYSAAAAPIGQAERRLVIPVKSSTAVRSVLLRLDCSRVSGWNEIDAVGLVDESGKTHWGHRVKASTSYASGDPHPVYRAKPPKEIQ